MHRIVNRIDTTNAPLLIATATTAAVTEASIPDTTESVAFAQASSANIEPVLHHALCNICTHRIKGTHAAIGYSKLYIFVCCFILALSLYLYVTVCVCVCVACPMFARILFISQESATTASNAVTMTCAAHAVARTRTMPHTRLLSTRRM